MEDNLSQRLTCPSCNNKGPMPVRSEFSQVKSYDDDISNVQWDAGPIYQVLQCPACDLIIFQMYNFHSITSEHPERTILYPTIDREPSNLPERVEKAYTAAKRVKSIDPNAYAVLLRRVLEVICLDRAAKGDSLFEQLIDLADRGEIPKHLIDVADGLRQFGNIGAHAREGELTAAQIPYLDRMAGVLIEYIYTAPRLVHLAQSELTRLKKNTSVKEAKKM